MKDDEIIIIDYHIGNLNSIANMIRKVGGKCKISSEVDDILEAKKLILPGVGSFDHGMSQLIKSDLGDAIEEKALKDKIPFLGICLGAQLLTKGSEEGNINGLGWLDSDTVRFNLDDRPELKIPHMGWAEIKRNKKSALLENLDDQSRFYFVHTYHFKPKRTDLILTTSQYGNYEFASALSKDNIYGVQFHPEKSHKFGMQLMTNFLRI
ncbi:imidazole glycerol phosphate synthase subunit HisH [Fulvivirgaceae bacterium BMA10]|uniref:Imidazole glycerol phosphate synthase subunit HisH n=1 Tax=Splendidivirga corallicola TaxID=3051826 RepID=A0ABT8KXW8_9BACT|nr:imidazole glycerol phosphate synthase subunit HisH [Fulvivirgaceae bacterium BMA10]